MSEPTQAELDQPDPVGGTEILGYGIDVAGNPAKVADDQEPVTTFGEA